MSTLQNTEGGSVTIILLLAINLCLIGVLGWQIWQKAQPAPKPAKSTNTQAQTSTNMQNMPSTTSTQNSGVAVGTLQISSRNVERKDEASAVMATVMEYMSNNNGLLPTAVDNGQVHSSGSSDVPSQLPPLSFYKTAMLQTGARPALTKDTLVVVTQAACGQNGATTSGTSRQVAIQYSVEQNNGSFTGACTDQ